MSQNKLEEFLDDVLSYVKFPFVRDEIKEELQSHLLEKIDDYMEQGYNPDQAEDQAIRDMGKPREIGIGLNKQHKPLLGWLIKITDWLLSLVGGISLVYIIPVLVFSIFSRNPVNKIPKENIVYRIDLDEQVRLDDRIINFTNLVYDDDGYMNIIYNYREKGLLPGGWGLGSIGDIYDNLGNEYFSRSGSESGGLRTWGRTSIWDFSQDAKELIIDYDYFNRKYRVVIPLEVGDSND